MRSCVQHSSIHDGKCLCFPHPALFPSFSLNMTQNLKKTSPDFIAFLFLCVTQSSVGSRLFYLLLLPVLYVNPGLSSANVPKCKWVGTALLRAEEVSLQEPEHHLEVAGTVCFPPASQAVLVLLLSDKPNFSQPCSTLCVLPGQLAFN